MDDRSFKDLSNQRGWEDVFFSPVCPEQDIAKNTIGLACFVTPLSPCFFFGKWFNALINALIK
jgi:hypothetical protein